MAGRSLLSGRDPHSDAPKNDRIDARKPDLRGHGVADSESSIPPSVRDERSERDFADPSVRSSRDRPMGREVGDPRGENSGARRYAGGYRAESEGEWTPRRSADTGLNGAHPPAEYAAGTPKSWAPDSPGLSFS